MDRAEPKKRVPTGGRRHRVTLPSGVATVRLGAAHPAAGAHGSNTDCVADSSAVGPPNELSGNDAAEPQTDGPSSAEVIAECRGVLDVIRAAIDEHEQSRRQSLEELQQVAVELAVAVASRVVREQHESHGSAISQLVSEAVERFGQAGGLTIALNPVDLQRLDALEDGAAWSERTEVSLVSNPEIAEGDCDIQGDDFRYVRRMELVLEEIRVDLMESLENAQVERRGTAAADSGLRRFPDRRETA